MASGNETPKFVRALRRMRPALTRGLPEVALLLKRPELKPYFTAYESNTILSQSLSSQQAEKFIEVLEFKSYDVYQKFLCVLKELRTDLAIRLEGMEREVSTASTASYAGSNQSSPEHTNLMNGFSGDRESVRMVEPVQESYYHHQEQLNERVRADDEGQRGQETAGVYGLSGSARNNFHHLRDLSYAGRQYLADHLNGDPPERHIFHRFCDALGVERRLVQAASRSRNPTAYLIQQYAERDDSATFQRLEVALNTVGRRDLYDELHYKLENGGFDDDDCN